MGFDEFGGAVGERLAAAYEAQLSIEDLDGGHDDGDGDGRMTNESSLSLMLPSVLLVRSTLATDLGLTSKSVPHRFSPAYVI